MQRQLKTPAPPSTMLECTHLCSSFVSFHIQCNAHRIAPLRLCATAKSTLRHDCITKDGINDLRTTHSLTHIHANTHSVQFLRSSKLIQFMLNKCSSSVISLITNNVRKSSESKRKKCAPTTTASHQHQPQLNTR